MMALPSRAQRQPPGQVPVPLRAPYDRLVLIFSISVSVDGFIVDRQAGFGWTEPDEEQFRFHLAQMRELGGFLCGRTARTRRDQDPSARG